MKQTLRAEIDALVVGAKIAFISAIEEKGYPNIKGMLTRQRDGLFTHYFSTNLSARRSQQFLRNGKACVYFCDEARFMGLMLVGEMQVLTDHEHKAMIWREGDEMYYPQGVDDGDYCVLRFTAERGNYYHGLENTDFSPEDYADA